MSKPPRFFIDTSQVREPYITVTGEDVRHIRSALRKEPGDLLTLLDGRGKEYTVKITAIEKAEIDTEIVDRRERYPASPVVVLGQGIAKADKMDLIVQKATELGVSSITPLVTERTIVKVKDEEKRVSRWQKICREAAMQCDRPDIPHIDAIKSFNDFLTPLTTKPKTLFLMPWEEGTQNIKTVLQKQHSPERVIILIGPEGGFSKAEAGTAASKGFHLVSLGPTILRTETAALAALSMIRYELS